jgi:hypothetical protein
MNKIAIVLILLLASKFSNAQNIGGFVRNNFIPALENAPKAIKISFDFRLLHSDAATNSFAFFQLGERLTNNTNPESPTPLDPKLNSNFAITSKANNKFSIRNTILSSPNSGTENTLEFENTQKITWVINNSTDNMIYLKPDGLTRTLVNKSWDLFVGKELIFNNQPVLAETASLRDFKFALRDNGTALALKFDNLIIENFSSFITSLPINLISLKASAVKEGIVLNWITATEINNQGFDIEKRLEDGSFLKIGYIAGSNNSNTEKKYSFIDVKARGVEYYRLKQNDYNGDFEYTEIVSAKTLDFPNNVLMLIYPNPSDGIYHISYQIETNAIVSLQLFNTNGQLVNGGFKDIKHDAGNHKKTIDLTGQNAGTYLCQLIINGLKYTSKIIIK